jgi:transcriptional activator HAC1
LQSWGQVLPEPKTNLPPRKRAKTADEKEQRRIERVKRNRLAAHNSRERKRAEVEALQLQKDELEARLKVMEDQMRQKDQELAVYRNMFPEADKANLDSLNPSMNSTLQANPLEAFQTKNDPVIINEPAMTTSTQTSPDSLLSTVDSFDSPMTQLTEDPATPRQATYAVEPDQTQHSAAMLCDLQCRSGSMGPVAARQSVALLVLFHWLIALNLRICMTTVISTVGSILTSSLTRTTQSPSRASSSLSFRLIRPTFLSMLMLSSPTRMPAQAQRLLLATSLALRRKQTISHSQLSSDASLAGRPTSLGRNRIDLVRHRKLESRRSKHRLALDIKRVCHQFPEYGGQKHFRRR